MAQPEERLGCRRAVCRRIVIYVTSSGGSKLRQTLSSSLGFVYRSVVMPAENLRWATLEALKNSPKAKISFDPYWSERGEVS